MKLVFTSYVSSKEYKQPDLWLKRISYHTGILERLAKDHSVISIERISYQGEYLQNGVKYLFIKLNGINTRFPSHMHRLIKSLQPDVVFVNGFIFPLQIIQLRWKLGPGVKIIVINHAEKPTGGIRRLLQRQADRYVHKYLFTSREMGIEWVRRGIIAQESKIAEVMEGSSSFQVMNKEKAREKTAVNGDPVYLWVGRLNANKDPLTVIKAFGKFIKHHPSAKLYMIYHTTDLKPEIDRLFERDTDLKGRITMVGCIPHEEMQYWYNSSDFIVSGSHYEGSGVAVCEAMSCGCIPLLTNIESFRMMTGRDKCGILYQPGNEAELFAVFMKSLEIDREKERQAVLQQFNNELSFDAIARRIEIVIAARDLSINQDPQNANRHFT